MLDKQILEKWSKQTPGSKVNIKRDKETRQVTDFMLVGWLN